MSLTTQEYQTMCTLLTKFGLNNVCIDLGDDGILVAFEGDIGAGKTLAIELVCQELSKLDIPFVIACEPVDEWVESPLPKADGTIDETCVRVNTLGVQYAESHTRALIQSNIYTTRVREQRKRIIEAKALAKKTGKKVVVITERSHISDFKIFGAIGLANKDINDVGWITYNNVVNVNPMITPDATVFIRTPNDVSRKRMIARVRKGEVDDGGEGSSEESEDAEDTCKINAEYHRQVAEYHDKVFGDGGTDPADLIFDNTRSITGLGRDKVEEHYRPLVNWVVSLWVAASA